MRQIQRKPFDTIFVTLFQKLLRKLEVGVIFSEVCNEMSVELF